MLDAFFQLAGFFDSNILNLELFGIGTIESILRKIVFLIVSFIAARIFIYFSHRIIERHSGKAKNEFTVIIIKKATAYVVYLITLLIVLNQWGIQITALIAALGIGGIAIAFAAQETVANLIGGFIILTDKPFFVGDKIGLPETTEKISETTDTRWGEVVSIGLRSTRIRTPDNILVVIPNAELLKREIFNYTRGDKKIRLRIEFGISYESSLDEAKKILMEEASKNPNVLKEPAPTIIVTKFGASSLDLRFRPWIDDATIMDDVTSELLEKVKKRFNLEGIEIPYPRNYVIFDKDKKNPV